MPSPHLVYLVHWYVCSSIISLGVNKKLEHTRSCYSSWEQSRQHYQRCQGKLISLSVWSNLAFLLRLLDPFPKRTVRLSTTEFLVLNQMFCPHCQASSLRNRTSRVGRSTFMFHWATGWLAASALNSSSLVLNNLQHMNASFTNLADALIANQPVGTFLWCPSWFSSSLQADIVPKATIIKINVTSAFALAIEAYSSWLSSAYCV